MEKIWIKSYPPQVPANVDLNEFSSLVSVQDWACSRFGDLPAFSNQGSRISFHEFDLLSRAFCSFLLHTAKVSKGDRVAIMMPNLLQYPVALFGALRAGCTVVNTNPLYTARELQYQLSDSGAQTIVVLENFAHTVQEVLGQTEIRQVITTRVGDLLPFPKAQITNFYVKHIKHMIPEWHIDGAIRFTEALVRGQDIHPPTVLLHRDDTAFLQYTGGTTGVPKGAILTHGNMVANLQQTTAWVKPVLKDGEETAIIPLPLYHVFALTSMLTFMKVGANNVLITNPRDIEGFVKELKHSKFSAMIGVNTLFNGLLNAPGIAEVDSSHLKLVVGGGMAVQRAVAERWQKIFGVPIIEGYGLTETAPMACANPLNIKEYTGTIGVPVPSTEAAIQDDAGVEMPLGEIGEICIRGPQVMKGYWNKPEETAKTISPDGWLRTGDLGFMDQRGYIKLVDRKKDMINVSGFKVFPNEIEDVVAMLPQVLEAVAISAADERSENAVKLVIVRKDPALTTEAVIEHCKRNLTAYKIPKYVVFRDEPLPKSNIGKILRRIVKDQEEARLSL